VIRLAQARNRRYRVLIVATHAVQYSAPIYRQMARHPELDMEVAYCSLRGAESGLDPDFGKEVKWDVPCSTGIPGCCCETAPSILDRDVSSGF